MFSRIRSAIGLALLLTLFTSIHVSAKGSFSFMAVTGAKLADEVLIRDPALTQDFFTFADFYRSKAEAPADPGYGYEVTRYYVNGHTETPFDKLHYYPETGFVYYDGIANGGSSEYDGAWYTAQPEIKSTFETALLTQIRLMELGTEEGSKAMVPPAEPLQAIAQAQTLTSIPQTQSLVPIILLTAGFVFLLAVAFLRFRKFSTI